MCSLEPFKIDLKGQEDGLTRLDLSLDDTFFAALEAEEVRRGHADVELMIQRTAERYFELHFHITGEVTVQCDRCLDDMPQAVDAKHKLVVKFGEEYSEEDDLVVVPEDDGILDTSWFIYEIIVLNIPIKHVHVPGKCNRAMIQMLEEHSAARSSDGVEKHDIDPRWSGLLKIKDLKE